MFSVSQAKAELVLPKAQKFALKAYKPVKTGLSGANVKTGKFVVISKNAKTKNAYQTALPTNARKTPGCASPIQKIFPVNTKHAFSMPVDASNSGQLSKTAHAVTTVPRVNAFSPNAPKASTIVMTNASTSKAIVTTVALVTINATEVKSASMVSVPLPALQAKANAAMPVLIFKSHANTAESATIFVKMATFVLLENASFPVSQAKPNALENALTSKVIENTAVFAKILVSLVKFVPTVRVKFLALKAK